MKTIVLLSGGIDSTVALAHSLHENHSCEAISFDYGQTHIRELEAAADIAAHYKVVHRTISLHGAFQPISALTGQLFMPETHATELDSTYVPARNLLMLSIAIAHAENSNSRAVIIGANADDHDGYLDCRPEFINAVDRMSRLGTLNHVGVWAPFIGMTKKEIIRYGNQINAPLWMTWSCYRGGDQPCGNCGACESNNAAVTP